MFFVKNKITSSSLKFIFNGYRRHQRFYERTKQELHTETILSFSNTMPVLYRPITFSARNYRVNTVYYVANAISEMKSCFSRYSLQTVKHQVIWIINTFGFARRHCAYDLDWIQFRFIWTSPCLVNMSWLKHLSTRENLSSLWIDIKLYRLSRSVNLQASIADQFIHSLPLVLCTAFGRYAMLLYLFPS